MAAIAMAEERPGGLLMPNQSLLYTGRVLACSQLNTMMHVCRELCGGQICVTSDFAAFQDPETAPWLEKYYAINADWRSEDRRRLLAFARDLLTCIIVFSCEQASTRPECRSDWFGIKRPPGLSSAIAIAAIRWALIHSR